LAYLSGMSVARYITPEERLRLLAVLPNPRDQLLVVLGLNTGFRVSELLSLKWGQLWSDGQPLAFVEVARRHIKGGRSERRKKVFSRRLPINAAAAAAIREYAFAVSGSGGPDPQDWVFASRKRLPGVITRRQAHAIMARAGVRAGLKEKVAPHGLRRAFGVDAYELTKDVLLVRDLLGHRSVLTTEAYLRRGEDRMHDVVHQLGASGQPAAASVQSRIYSV
jgi:integrase